MTAIEARGQRAAFHELRVAAVEHLTDDSAAITFDVPDDLRRRSTSRPGSR